MQLDAAVIGSGLGGLACAAVLARAGVKVGVFEQHVEPGGFATSFRRDGYDFEVSLHVLDAVGPGQPNRELLEALGIAERLDLLQGRWVRRELWPDRGEDLWLPDGVDGYVAALAERFPGCEAGVRALFALARDVHARCYEAIEDGRLRLDRGSRTLHRLLTHTAADVLADVVGHPGAERVLGTLATYQGLFAKDLAAIPYLLLMWGYHGCGAHYPRGGSRSLTESLVAVIEERGGRVEVGRAVASIACARGRARGITLEDGTEVAARWVVSNASPLVTFGAMLPPDAVDPRYRARLEAMQLSGSFYRVYLGLDAPVESLAPMAYETFLHDQVIAGRTVALPVSMTAASLLDREVAPPGCGNLSITTHAPLVDQLAGVDKDRVGDALIAAVEAHVVPGLADHVAVREVAHPGTFARYTRHPGGAVLGFAAIPSQSGPRRLHGVTPIRNLYLASAWVFPGAGQTASMLSGRLAASEILRGVL